MESRQCQRCRADIPQARLQVLPDTFLCVTCSKEIGGEFKIISMPEHTGKAGSIKRNYGSWTFTRVRKKIPPKPE